MKNWCSKFANSLSGFFMRWLTPQRDDSNYREQLQGDSEENSYFDMTVEYLDQHKVVKITTHGELNLEANNKLVSAVLAASKQYATNLILVDHRSVEINMNFVTVYDLPEHNQTHGVERHLRVALVYTQSKELDQIFKFYENRSHIMDFQHCVFTDEDRALRWLKNE